MILAAFTNNCSRLRCVATIVPFPGNASPRASLRLFIELAVNIPEQEPHVGQAECSTSSTCLSLTESSPASIITSIRSRARPSRCPASMGPPDTKIAGILSRMAAISMPGVILSQLLIHTIASALWAFTIYSTLSAIRSREGSE